MADDIETLAKLSDTDMARLKALDELDAAREAVAKGKAALAELEEARDAVQAELDAVKERERGAQRRLTQYRQQLQRADKALSTGMGDAEAAERQRVNSLELIDKAETEVLEAMEAQEGVQPRLRAAQAKVDEAAAALKQVEEQTPATIRDLKARIAELKAAAEPLRAQLSSDVGTRYDMLLHRKRPPVARVQERSCRICRITMTPQSLIQMKRGELMPCRGCGRWLVVEEE